MAIRLAKNPFQIALPIYGEEQRKALDPASAAAARHDLKSWPGYDATPLIEAKTLASRIGVGGVWIKDEGSRRPLKSFKSLGGAFALGEFLRDAIEQETQTRPSYDSLFAGNHRDLAHKFHVTAATDGNHGRSLAWGAQLFGAQCTIFVPRIVTEDRIYPLRELGAEVIQVDGNYDATLAHCAEQAKQNHWVHLQDTSYQGFTAPHKRIMEGYTLMSEEVRHQLPPGIRISHAFLQVGCGGMAASLVADFWARDPASVPITILVQSENVAPLVDTFETGRKHIDDGDHDTIMVGIACGEVALLCEQLLYPAAYAAMTIDDCTAIETMRACARSIDVEKGLVVGETGAAGIAALELAASRSEFKHELALDENSQILVINSEGDTAPEIYRRIVQ